MEYNVNKLSAYVAHFVLLNSWMLDVHDVSPLELSKQLGKVLFLVMCTHQNGMSDLRFVWQSSSSLESNGQSLMPLQRYCSSIHGPFSHRNMFKRHPLPTSSSPLFWFWFDFMHYLSENRVYCGVCGMTFRDDDDVNKWKLYNYTYDWHGMAARAYDAILVWKKEKQKCSMKNACGAYLLQNRSSEKSRQSARPLQ